jgi:putative polyketide hydroxylase
VFERSPSNDGPPTVDAATNHLHVRSEAGGRGNTTGGNLAVIFGYRYRSTAILAEGTTQPGELLHPAALCGEPGTRAPHLTLFQDGKCISSIDLYVGEFALLAGPAGQPWVDAARTSAAELDIPLTAYRIGQELTDPTGAWGQAHQVDADGR